MLNVGVSAIGQRALSEGVSGMGARGWRSAASSWEGTRDASWLPPASDTGSGIGSASSPHTSPTAASTSCMLRPLAFR